MVSNLGDFNIDQFCSEIWLFPTKVSFDGRFTMMLCSPGLRGPDAASGYTGSETDLQLALHNLSSLSCSILVISVHLPLLLRPSLSCSLSSNEALSPSDQSML